MLEGVDCLPRGRWFGAKPHKEGGDFCAKRLTHMFNFARRDLGKGLIFGTHFESHMVSIGVDAMATLGPSTGLHHWENSHFDESPCVVCTGDIVVHYIQ